MKSVFFLICILLLTSISLKAQNKVLNNERIIELSKSGLSKLIIIKTIEDSKEFDFNTSIDALKDLSKKGVDDDVIMAIMNKEKEQEESIIKVDDVTFKKDEYGLFYLIGQQKHQIHSHLNESKMNAGFMSAIFKAVVSGKISSNILPTGIKEFYFNLNKNNGTTNAVLNISNSIADPNEGILVRMKQKGKKRYVKVGKAGMGGLKTHIKPKDKIKYKVEKVKGALYKLTLEYGLGKGDYGFIFGAINPGLPMRVYDFTIK